MTYAVNDMGWSRINNALFSKKIVECKYLYYSYVIEKDIVYDQNCTKIIIMYKQTSNLRSDTISNTQYTQYTQHPKYMPFDISSYFHV